VLFSRQENAIMKFLAFLRGVLLGAALGALVGLLLAPRPGVELQAELRQRYDEVMAEGRRAAAQRRAELERQLADAKRVPLSAQAPAPESLERKA
jgi:gas vesicle protein